MNKFKFVQIGKLGVRLTVWFMILFTLGCATYGESLVQDGTVAVELLNSKDVRLSNVDVYLKDNETVVRGQVENQNISSFMSSGYVQVEIISPGGERYQQCERYLGGYGKSKHKSAYFSTEFPVLPVQGTIVRLSAQSLDYGKDLRCDG